jgi:RimJ/RimL family protein N-acetyltransferase
VLHHAFEVLGQSNIAATVDKLNVASRRILEKLGFSVIGEKLIHSNPIVYYAVSPARFRALHGTSS